MSGNETILEVRNLKKYFFSGKKRRGREPRAVKALDGVSFSMEYGETLGVVGESGCGKSTLGRTILRLHEPTEGQVVYRGKNLAEYGREEMRQMRRELQIIFQDPYSSLNPRMTVRELICAPLDVFAMGSKEEKEARVIEIMDKVGLPLEFMNRYPHEFSGGQRQRISIARSLAMNPSFIICDEIVSALDVSIQAQIVGLMMKIQEELGLTYIFIGHDLSVVRHISNNVAVMYLGKIMELTGSDELYEHPLHPYTQALISAAPIPNPTVDRARERILLEGDLPSPIHPPRGCNFCTRCKYADERCRTEEPAFVDVGNQHFVACHKVAAKGGGR